MPGGRGISFYPSGRWTRHLCGSIRPVPASSSSSSTPVRPVIYCLCDFPCCSGPEFRGCLVWSGVSWFGLVAASLFRGSGGFRPGLFSGFRVRVFGLLRRRFFLLLVCASLHLKPSFLHRKSAPPASRPQWRPTPHPL